MDMKFMIIPLSCAIMGYVTNWLAIKMLFRPLTEKRIFGIRIPFTPGLIPAQRHRLAQKVSETIASKLLTAETLHESLNSDETFELIHVTIVNILEKLENDDTTIGSKINEDFFKNLKTKIYEFYCESISSETTKNMLFSKIFENPENIEVFLETSLKRYLPSALDYLQTQIDTNSAVDGKLKEIVIKIIEDSAGSLLGIFINPEKIYRSIIKNLKEYISDKNNRQIISDKICELSSEFLNKPSLSEDFNKLYDNLDDMFKENYDKIFDYSAEKIEDKIYNTKIKDLMKLINDKDNLILQIENLIKYVLQKYSAGVIASFNFQKVIEDKMNKFDVGELETIITSIVKKELGLITALGGILGFILGIVTALISA